MNFQNIFLKKKQKKNIMIFVLFHFVIVCAGLAGNDLTKSRIFYQNQGAFSLLQYCKVEIDVDQIAEVSFKYYDDPGSYVRSFKIPDTLYLKIIKKFNEIDFMSIKSEDLMLKGIIVHGAGTTTLSFAWHKITFKFSYHSGINQLCRFFGPIIEQERLFEKLLEYKKNYPNKLKDTLALLEHFISRQGVIDRANVITLLETIANDNSVADLFRIKSRKLIYMIKGQ